MSQSVSQTALGAPKFKTGYKAQQVINAVSLGTSSTALAQYQVTCDVDSVGIVIKTVLTTLKGTGVYAGTASVLSSLAEIVVQSQNSDTLHDFKTPSSHVPIVAFMFDNLYRKGGYYTPDIAISVDGTATQTTIIWTGNKYTEFPLKISLSLAALSAIYSTVGTGTAVVTVTATPIKNPTQSAVSTDYSVMWSLAGLTAQNNDVTAQILERSRIRQMALLFSTETDLTDVTLQTAEVDFISLPLAEMKQFDVDTLSGHQSKLERIVLNQPITLSKANATFKINESTADQPTVFLIGNLR